ncbi:MAG: hypothetical protein ACFFDN_06990, partial [Candidatus Hodarchaeota archaeon]
MNIIFISWNLNYLKYSFLYDGLISLSKKNKIHIVSGGDIPKGIKIPKNIFIHTIGKIRIRKAKNV